MQVTVPPGIFPGMPFLVETAAGQMQVTCPPDATQGQQMLVNVPVAQPTAVPMGEPMAEPMAQPMCQPMVVAAMPVVAPDPQVMAVPGMQAPGPMDDRVGEIKSGCYHQLGAPCCYLQYLNVQATHSTVVAGPGCFCCCVVGCCPGCCGTFVAPPGTAAFKAQGSSETLTWQTPRSFKMTGGMSSGETYVKSC